jgi:hypothetical protein
MAIAAAIRTAATAAKNLIKKNKLKEGLKKAVNVTTKKTSELKSKARETATKVKPTIEKAKEKIKPAVEKTKEVAGNVGSKMKEAARTASVKARRKMGPEGRATAKRVGDAAKIAVGGTVGGALGMATAPTAMGGILGAGVGATLAKDKKLKGAAIGGAAGAALGLAATAGLASSMLKSSTPKESQFESGRLPDGRYSTKLQDPSKNNVITGKYLSDKEIADVKTQLAILDSIVTSDDPKAQRQQFISTVAYLSQKYKITAITGKNLSIQIPYADQVMIPKNYSQDK